MIPELDLCFDLGLAPRAMLPAKHVALTHGHMDHAAGLAYYFSQRHFQGMGTGTVVCHPDLEKPIHNIMNAWVDLERQRTPYNVIALEPDAEVEIKNNHFLRAFATDHTTSSTGFIVIERRSKLKPELQGLSQEQIVEVKKRGEEVTDTFEIPLITYTGDTMWGDHLLRDDVLASHILITECTFVEPGHKSRAKVGKHLHAQDVARLIQRCDAQHIVLTHLSRRTHMNQARQAIEDLLPEELHGRVHFLMDNRRNRDRYDEQLRDAEANA